METSPISTSPDASRCAQSELLCAHLLKAVCESERSLIEAHLAACADCRRERESLRPVLDWFASWPTDVLRPLGSLKARLALRISAETGEQEMLPPARPWSEPEWEQMAAGIAWKLLATDTEKHRVSMLVRLEPGAAYPSHTHAGGEELHLLTGELQIDDRKLFPGDYNYAAPGTADRRVWSGTGCTCVLITSTKDILT